VVHLIYALRSLFSLTFATNRVSDNFLTRKYLFQRPTRHPAILFQGSDVINTIPSDSFRPTINHHIACDELSILPLHLTICKAIIVQYHEETVVRAAVVGNMKLRDVVAQLLPRTCSFDVWIYVKSQGAWILPDVKTRIYDLIKT
jgi:hypothetical protein